MIFNDPLHQNRLANQSQLSSLASMGRGNESLYKRSRSHLFIYFTMIHIIYFVRLNTFSYTDILQRWPQSHIMVETIKNLFFRKCPRILKLGLQHWRFKLYTFCINDTPELTFSFFMARSNLDAYVFEWGNCCKVIY